jgi:hypothetical protein
VADFLDQDGHAVAGVFLDDFAFERQWWSGAEADRDLVWGPWDGRPGWRQAPYTWNESRVTAIEEGVAALVAEHCGPGGLLIVNGNARQLAGTRRFAENAGAPQSEAWDRLEEPGLDPTRFFQAGDLLQVNGVGPSGAWGDWAETAAGHGGENLQRAAALAIERGGSVGLAYGVAPADGQSRYSLFLDPAHPVHGWPDYQESHSD